MNPTVALACTVSSLAPDDCLELLSRCDGATLACTDRARPTVLPVMVSVVGSTVRVALPHGVQPSSYSGQVIALGASVPATPGAEGCWVLVRGTLCQVPGGQVLDLEPLEMEGRVLAMTPRRRWLRW
jgi:hypothetical protein